MQLLIVLLNRYALISVQYITIGECSLCLCDVTIFTEDD